MKVLEAFKRLGGDPNAAASVVTSRDGTRTPIFSQQLLTPVVSGNVSLLLQFFPKTLEVFVV